MLTEVMMVTKAMMIMKARAGEGSNEMAETEWEKENILQLFSLMRVLGYVSSCPRPEAVGTGEHATWYSQKSIRLYKCSL